MIRRQRWRKTPALFLRQWAHSEFQWIYGSETVPQIRTGWMGLWRTFFFSTHSLCSVLHLIFLFWAVNRFFSILMCFYFHLQVDSVGLGMNLVVMSQRHSELIQANSQHSKIIWSFPFSFFMWNLLVPANRSLEHKRLGTVALKYCLKTEQPFSWADMTSSSSELVTVRTDQ